MRAGLAAILLANGLALFVPGLISSRGPVKADATPPKGPTDISALAASPRGHERVQLFATDSDSRIWTCQVGSSLICRWQLVLARP